MKNNKFLALLTALVMILSVAAFAQADEQITLNFWHIWPTDQMSEIVDEYIEIFEAEHPNIKIEATATQEVEYQNTKLRIAASNKSQGDVFFCYGGGYAKDFVDAGAVLPHIRNQLPHHVQLMEARENKGLFDNGFHAAVCLLDFIFLHLFVFQTLYLEFF